MARRALLTTAVAALALAGGAGCGGGDGEDGSPTEVVGPITEISRSGGRIEAITVRSGGETEQLRVDPAIDYGFDLEHLEEHRRTGDPVRCTVTRRGDDLVATVILDA
jgi:hypothetical protein